MLGAGYAQAEEAETIQHMASTEEIAKVAESVARINCKAQEAEKESAKLYELDDAECEIGQ